MIKLNSLPINPHLSDVFKKYPKGLRPLLEFHDAVLRGESALTIAERELIAAYVSGLNNCSFCFNAHAKLAADFGVDPGLLEDLLNDIDSTDVDERFKSILKYVKKLTLTPSRLVQDDVDSILAMGYEDDVIYDVATICGLFNLMNRIVEGMGVVSSTSVMIKNRESTGSSKYIDFGKIIGVLQ